LIKGEKMTKVLRTILCLVVVFAFTCSISLYPANSEEIPLNKYGIRSTNPYVVDRIVLNGKTLDKIIVPGPPTPPAGFIRPTVAVLPAPNPAAGINILSNVPASTWAFGCSATSASMMFGYYDNSGFTNMYAGPTNGGVFPMTNATWGSVVINSETRALNPLSATRKGLDGRTIKGHVDDYWIQYDNFDDDPFITGGWTEHTKGQCTGDYMGTNQSTFACSDGSTYFWWWGDGTPLYDYTGCEPDYKDGCHGMKVFAESRGYTVQSLGNFNQYIYPYGSNTTGFTFANYKAEIDAGRPVLIQVEGHTMLGFGYDDAGSTIYIHDTWDYSDHTMTWGGSYSGMEHYGVTVLRLNSLASAGVDFNSDGKTDIVWQNTVTGRNIAWYMNGVARTGSVYLPTQDTAWTIVGCADFNADGKTDILFWNPATGRNIVWYMNGVTRTGSVYLPTQDTAWTNAGPGDFNNDGKPDILWRNMSTGRNICWYMNGVTRTGSVYLPTQDAAWTLAGRDDFNADGKTDIVWWNPATGRNICWYMNGVARTGSVYMPTQDTAWENVGSGDFNNDGKPDILWRNTSTGKNICWYMNGVARTGSVYLPTQPDLNWKLVN
jgi:hypothetical protein